MMTIIEPIDELDTREMTREEAIKRIKEHMVIHKMFEPRAIEITKALNMAISALKQPEPCDVCKNLEEGDTLYSYSSWDGGIGFDYIYDIKFCPKCGRRLKNDY